MVRKQPLPFDPVQEAARHWAQRWDGADVMAAATSIMRVQQLLLAGVDEALRPWKLSFARYEALVLLTFSRRGSLPMSRMGERSLIHPTTVTSIVALLERQGFVNRVRHPTDGRTTLIEITPAGRTVVAEATEALVAIRFALPGVSGGQLQELFASMRQIRLRAGDFQPPTPDVPPARLPAKKTRAKTPAPASGAVKPAKALARTPGKAPATSTTQPAKSTDKPTAKAPARSKPVASAVVRGQKRRQG